MISLMHVAILFSSRLHDFVWKKIFQKERKIRIHPTYFDEYLIREKLTRNGNKFLVRENYGKREDEGGELVLYEMMAVISVAGTNTARFIVESIHTRGCVLKLGQFLSGVVQTRLVSPIASKGFPPRVYLALSFNPFFHRVRNGIHRRSSSVASFNGTNWRGEKAREGGQTQKARSILWCVKLKGWDL